MSETWFNVRKYGNKIEPVSVERSTASSVWIGGRRNARDSEWDSYFPSWTEAHSYLLQRAEVNLDRVRRSLQVAQSELGHVKGMKPPAIANATQQRKEPGHAGQA